VVVFNRASFRLYIEGISEIKIQKIINTHWVEGSKDYVEA